MWGSRWVARRQLCRNLSTSPHLRAPKRDEPTSDAFVDESTPRTGQGKFLIDVQNGTFYQQSPSTGDDQRANPPFFENTTFRLHARGQRAGGGGMNNSSLWAVVSTAALPRTRFLQVLSGQYICMPPSARTYPEISAQSLSLSNAIKYIGFDAERGNSVGGTATRGAYLSARYESRREETDFSLRDYLSGHTELNALERVETGAEKTRLTTIAELLDLQTLLDLPVSNLSNGQTRRARIAKALMAEPKALLLDGPFMGLDPRSQIRISNVLEQVARTSDLGLVISLGAREKIPEWIEHAVVVDESFNLVGISPPPSVPVLLKRGKMADSTNRTADGLTLELPPFTIGEAVVEMQGVKVSYGERTVLGDWRQTVDGEERSGLWWNLHRGQRCGIFGANGSGKTTMLSLITSDHPQTYSLPIKLFGRSRLPGPGEPGISVFDLQRRMGHSSPEVHSFFPKRLSVRRVLESAWADAPLARAQLTVTIDQKVNGFLRWFEKELNPTYAGPGFWEQMEFITVESKGRHHHTFTTVPRSTKSKPGAAKPRYEELYEELMLNDSDLHWADRITFGELNFAAQRLALFLRAIIASPDLVILDEAFSGMDESMRAKALTFLSHGEGVLAYSSVKTSKGNTVTTNGTCPSFLSFTDAVTFGGLTTEQALLVISHSQDDVPSCIREWICLPDPGEGLPPRTGELEAPLESKPEGWEQIWGAHLKNETQITPSSSYSS